MTVTKRVKTVKVKYVETKSYYPEYTCPSCHTTFVGCSVSKQVLRWICDCGQELKK